MYGSIQTAPCQQNNNWHAVSTASYASSEIWRSQGSTNSACIAYIVASKSQYCVTKHNLFAFSITSHHPLQCSPCYYPDHLCPPNFRHRFLRWFSSTLLVHQGYTSATLALPLLHDRRILCVPAIRKNIAEPALSMVTASAS